MSDWTGNWVPMFVIMVGTIICVATLIRMVAAVPPRKIAEAVPDPNPAPYCSIAEWLAWCEREEKRKAQRTTER